MDWKSVGADRKKIGMMGTRPYEPPRDPYHEKIQLCHEPNGLCRDPYEDEQGFVSKHSTFGC